MKIAKLIKEFLAAHLKVPQFSWNHSKNFVMNGNSLVAGGENYWKYNETKATKTVIGLDMYIQGQVALGGHEYSNYYWYYLNNIPPTDTLSWAKKAQIVNGIDSFATCTNVPAFNTDGNASYSEAYSMKALSVSNMGNWPTPTGIPVQTIVAINDFIINLITEINLTYLKTDLEPSMYLVTLLSYDNTAYQAILKKANINQAAWASRIARYYAVKNAKKSVFLSQQALVSAFGMESSVYSELITKINNELGISWDGYLRPYDLMIAMCYPLAAMKKDGVSTDDGIKIICSYHDKGWKDPVKSTDFESLLKKVFFGLNTFANLITDSNEIDGIVDDYVTYQRPVHQSDTEGNHCKMVMVDGAMVYIGSENAYPTYNEQFGVWIEDPLSIKAFTSGYWDKAWGNSEKKD